MKTVKLADLAASRKWSINGGPFGSKLVSKDYRDEGVPVIRGANLPDDRWFSADDLVYVSEEKADELLANNAHPGDVIFTQRGTLGQVGMIPLDGPYKRYVISQSQMKMTVDPTIADSRWIYYYFRQSRIVESIKAHAVTSGVPHINLGILKHFQIPLPELPIQIAAADCLGSFDAQIENLNQQTKLLEESVRLVFTEQIARSIQRGVIEETTLNGVATYINRGIAPIYDEASSKTVINQKCIRHGKLDVALARTLSNDIPEEKRLQKGDVLINSTGTGTLGRVAQVREALESATVDTHVTIVRPRPEIPMYFFGQQLLRLEGHFTSLGEGATNQTELKRERIRETPFVLPDAQLMADFDATVEPIFEQIEVLRKQITQLRQARDLLLPRLISGQLRL